MRQFHYVFTVYSIFSIGLFSKWFSNPFIVHSRTSFFVWIKLLFLASVFLFCSHAVFWQWVSAFFLLFYLIFLEMVFLIHSKSILGLVFRLDDENSLNCTSGTFVLCFIWDLFTHFHYFWSQLSSDFGHAVTVSGAKSQWFCGLKIFRSKIKVELENAVRKKNRFLASGFLFTISLWFSLLFRFFGSEFYLNGFPNPFIVHSRNSFFWLS